MLSQLEDCLERWKFLFREKLLNIPIIRGISHFESVFIIRSGATALFSKRIKLVRRYLFHSYSPPGQDRICECIPLFSLSRGCGRNTCFYGTRAWNWTCFRTSWVMLAAIPPLSTFTALQKPYNRALRARKNDRNFFKPSPIVEIISIDASKTRNYPFV